MAISNVWTLDCQFEPRTLMQLAVQFGLSLPGYSAGYDPKLPSYQRINIYGPQGILEAISRPVYAAE